MLRKLLLAAAVASSLTACSKNVAINTLSLGASYAQFNADVVGSKGILLNHRDQFTAKELAAIDAVQLSINKVHQSISDILGRTSAPSNVVVDIADFLSAIDNLKTSYAHAHALLKPRIKEFSPVVVRTLIEFHRTVVLLDASYNRLLTSTGDQTALIIETLDLIGQGAKLFGAR